MNRRTFAAAVSGGFSLLGGSARSAGSAKRVGILSWDRPKDAVDFERFFLAALSSKGWVEGRNLALTRVYAEENVGRVAGLAADLVRSGAHVIVTGGHVTTLAVARATSSIPIVFAFHLPFAIEQGLIDSYAHPGRNVTGAAIPDRDVGGKKLQYLKQLVPSAKRLAWFLPDVLASVERLSGGQVDLTPLLSDIAHKAGFEDVRFFGSRPETDMAAVFDEIDRWHAHALTSFTSTADQPKKLAELALSHRIPAASALREAVDAGALFSYAPKDTSEQLFAARAAEYVDRILRGARPATLPVEFATRYELVINARTAEMLGVRIPPSLLVEAALVR